jgi:hypothetical protein
MTCFSFDLRRPTGVGLLLLTVACGSSERDIFNEPSGGSGGTPGSGGTGAEPAGGEAGSAGSGASGGVAATGGAGAGGTATGGSSAGTGAAGAGGTVTGGSGGTGGADAGGGSGAGGTGGSGGSGSPVCSGDTEACGDACVDTQTSTSHCGTCGRACLPGAVCESGVCSAVWSECGSAVSCAELCASSGSGHECVAEGCEGSTGRVWMANNPACVGPPIASVASCASETGGGVGAPMRCCCR